MLLRFIGILILFFTFSISVEAMNPRQDTKRTYSSDSCENQKTENEAILREDWLESEMSQQERIGKNFHEIIPGEYYRSAQLKGKDLESYITTFGIKSVINLRGAHPGEDWYDEELAVTQALGVALVNIGMSAGRLPHRKDLLALLEAFEKLPRPMLVHCRAGADRTGEASAIYLYDFKGKTKNESLSMLTAKYQHLATFTPAKRYFFNDVYQGKDWAIRNYDPCKANYKYYEKEKYCDLSH